MVFKYETDGKTVRMSTDKSVDHSAIFSRTDRERLEALTDDEITAAIILDPEQPPLSEEELRAFLEHLRNLNEAKRRSARKPLEQALREDEKKFDDEN